jgi:formylmethanofuran dehydrogenase subunit C
MHFLSIKLLRFSHVIFSLALIVLLPSFSMAANRYWVGAVAGNWNDPANWAVFSGAAGGASVPGVNDIAIFDANGLGTCNLNAIVNVQGILINPGFTGSIIQQSGISMTIGNAGFLMAGGTFTGGDSNIDLNAGQFLLASGIFTSTTATFFIGGTLNSDFTLIDISGGTFNHNNGSVRIDPGVNGCATRTLTITTGITVIFNTLEVIVDNLSCNEDILNISGAGIFNVAGLFSHQDGLLNGNTLRVQGDIEVTANADGGTAAILLNGNADQEYATTGTSRFSHLWVNKLSGAVNPAAGTTELSAQQFTIDNGTFNAPSGEFQIGGTWNASVTLFSSTGGTFNHNNGTVRLDPDFTGCATRTATISTSNTLTFFNLIAEVTNLSCNEDILSVSGAGSIVVENDFTHANGFVNAGTIEVQGDVYLDAGADGGTSIILLNGTTDQEYFTLSAARFTHLLVDKVSGEVFPGTGTSDFYIQQLTINNGIFHAPTGTLYVGGSWNADVSLININGGTFDHNSGTVSIDPDFSGCATRTATLSAPTPLIFFNLIVDVDNQSCNEDVLAVTGASSIIVENDFTHFDGLINTGTIQVRQDVYLEVGADGGTATVLLNGTTDQEYFNSSTARFTHIRVDKSTGDVLPGAGTTEFFLQQLTLDNGNFYAPAGTLFIGGPWNSDVTLLTVNGGAFLHNSGTVQLDPDFAGCATRTATLSAPATLNFYNLIVEIENTSCNEDILSVTGASSVIVENDFTHADGFINTGTIEVRHDVYLQVGADGGSATVLLNGTVDQEYHNASVARFTHIRVDKVSGVVNPGIGTSDFYVQRFTIDNGTFNAPTGTFFIGGTWNSDISLVTINGGVFNHNMGTVRIDPDFGGCATRTSSFTSSLPIFFYNLIVDVDNTSCNEDILTVSGASTIIVENDFTHFDGFINTGTVEVRGDVYLEANADGGTATILMNGTADQEYNNASTARFSHLRVDKVSGVISPGVGTTSFLLQRFTLDNGVFNAPSGSFNVGGIWDSNVTLFTISGGSFNHNNGVVHIDPDFGGCTTRTATLLFNIPISFYDLIVDVDNTSCTEDILITSGATNLVVENDFTQFDGFVNTGTIEVHGDIYLEAGADGGTATILLNGTTDQEYHNASSARFAHLRVNKPSGVVLPGAGTTSFLVQQFTLENGEFTAPTGSFDIGGTWSPNVSLMTVTGGIFNSNSGTVRFDPDFTPCGLRTATLSSTQSLVFFNLVVDVNDAACTEDILTGTGVTTHVVENLLTLNDGIVNTITWDVRGNVVVIPGFDGGSGILLFTGSNTQTIDLTGATAAFNGDVVINKTADVLTLLSAFQLDATGQDLNMISGNIVSSAGNELIIGDNVIINNASVNSYVDGPIQKIGNDVFIFPTGKGGVYSPLHISAPGIVTDAFTAEYFLADANGAGYSTAIREVSLTDISTCDYWILDRISGTSAVNVTLTWNQAAGCYGFSNPSILAVTRWDGAQWVNEGSTGYSTSGTFGTVISGSIASFSPLAIASVSAPLPVELVSFSASWNAGVVELNWKTSSELNNDFFSIERSENGIEFDVINIVEGAGTTTESREYLYVDDAPLSGRSYYRLKQTDFDGSFTYSSVVSVWNPRETDEWIVYPNPVTNKAFVTFNKKVYATVYNVLNQPLKQIVNTEQLSVDDLPSGVYLIRNNKGQVLRLVIN